MKNLYFPNTTEYKYVGHSEVGYVNQGNKYLCGYSRLDIVAGPILYWTLATIYLKIIS